MFFMQIGSPGLQGSLREKSSHRQRAADAGGVSRLRHAVESGGRRPTSERAVSREGGSRAERGVRGDFVLRDPLRTDEAKATHA